MDALHDVRRQVAELGNELIVEVKSLADAAAAQMESVREEVRRSAHRLHASHF